VCNSDNNCYFGEFLGIFKVFYYKIGVVLNGDQHPLEELQVLEKGEREANRKHGSILDS
jgi:signal-transduction protein with cAMP-binding, CBS, and nucleotidyltransferase domain